MGVGVMVGVRVAVGVRVLVGVGVLVRVKVGDGGRVPVDVEVGVAVLVGVPVGDGVGVLDGTGESVATNVELVAKTTGVPVGIVAGPRGPMAANAPAMQQMQAKTATARPITVRRPGLPGRVFRN